MKRVFDVYRAVHEQGFIPILAIDHFDARVLVEGAVEAGVRVVEYTLRRPESRELLPWLRRQYPDLVLLAGSVVDDDRVVGNLRRMHPQLMTLQELADIGMDGFVSMLGWSTERIARWSPTHLVVPCVHTMNEAYAAVCAGVHFNKMIGPELGLVKLSRAMGGHQFPPIMITGGMLPERMLEAMQAGAVSLGAGFELMLKDKGPGVSAREVAVEVKRFLTAFNAARAQAWPRVHAAIGGPAEQWLQVLPHYHPFGD